MFEKTDEQGYLKNKETGVVINSDINKLEAYKKKKETFLKNKKISEEVSNLKNEMSEIKSILVKVLDRIGKNGD